MQWIKDLCEKFNLKKPLFGGGGGGAMVGLTFKILVNVGIVYLCKVEQMWNWRCKLVIFVGKLILLPPPKKKKKSSQQR